MMDFKGRGGGLKIDRGALNSIASKPLSQDNVFHTLPGLMEMETSVYDKDLDILNFNLINNPS